LKAGADFAELAKKNSEDGSAQNGGDLGFMAHGQTVPEFDQTIFKLQPKEISGIVTTQFGYHIIQVLDKETAHVKPLEEVKASLTEDLKKQNLAERMQSLADQVHSELVKDPSGAAEIAKRLGVDLITIPKGSVNEAIPGLGVAPEIGTLLAGMKKGDVSQIVVLPANREAVFVVQDVFPTHVAEFEDVKNDVRESLIQQQLGQIAIKKANEAADRLRKGEDIAKVAKSMGLEVTTSSDFARTDAVEGLGEAQYLSDAFTAPVGTILGPTLIQGRWVVTKLIARTNADMSALSAERDSLLHEIKRKKATDVNEMLMDSIVARLESEGKVKVHRDEIQRMLANFRK
jgi:peptidyl-prolyl cis-trans isomerase D